MYNLSGAMCYSCEAQTHKRQRIQYVFFEVHNHRHLQSSSSCTLPVEHVFSSRDPRDVMMMMMMMIKLNCLVTGRRVGVPRSSIHN